MSKKSTTPFKSALADSPEELAERMKDINAEVIGLIKGYLASDLHKMVVESDAFNRELLSKKGLKHLGKALLAIARKDPEKTMNYVYRGVLWTEKTVMTRRGARKATEVKQSELETLLQGLDKLGNMPKFDLLPDEGSNLDVEEKVASHLRSLGLDVVADPEAGPGRLRLVDEVENDPLMVAINRAFIDEEYDDERQIVDAYLLDIRGVLKGGDRLQALQMISVMAQSHIPSAVKAAKSLQEAL